MGSFSSAGPFAFGPLFYWMIILSYIIMPFTFVAPWIFTGLMGVITVLVLSYCGRLIGGNKLGILTGILTATAPQLISRSLSLGQHTYVALTSSLLLLSFILLWQKKKSLYALCMGLSLGAALSMHFQSINLFIFFPTLLFIPKIPFIKKIVMIIIMGIGFLIPSIPTIAWESRQEFANTRNLLDYLLVAQYRIYVPNSWKIFLSDFLPYYWSFVVGSFKPLGLILMVVTPLILGTTFLKKKLPGVLVPFGVIFSVFLLINRYYRGERSEGYLIYMLPLILVLTSYAIYVLLFQNPFIQKFTIPLKIIGSILLLAMLGGNLTHWQNHLKFVSPVTAMEKSIDELISKYPNQKFTVYDYKWQNSYQSQPLSFLLEKRGKIDPNGMPIGFGCANIQKCELQERFTQIGAVADKPLLDLSTAQNIKDPQWFNVNPANLYDDLMRWSKTEKLKSNFYF